MTDAAAAAPVATATPTTSSPLPPRAAVAVDRSPQLLVGFAVLLLGVAFLPPLYSPAIASRLPVVLVAGAVGLVGLVRLAPRDPTARWLAGLLLWSLVAAIASGARWLALAPGVGSDKGWLVLAAFGGWWALGRRSPRGADDLVLGAIGVGVAINALIAILQSTVGSANPASPLYESGGRSSGLMGNPVFLAAFLAAGVAAIASASVRSERLPVRVASLATVTVGALGLNLSGGRIGAVAMAVATAAALRRTPWKRWLPVVAAIVFGTLLSLPVADRAGSATTRLSEGTDGGGLTARAETWRAGLGATLERPVLGWGPGRWQAATAPRNTLRSARAETSTVTFGDAHNLALEQLVTTGVPGLVLAAGFAVSTARRARGPFAHLALALALFLLLEPMNLVVGALLLMALGLSDRRRGSPADASLAAVDPDTTVANDPKRPAVSRAVWGAAVGVAATVGLAASVPYVLGARWAQTASTARTPGAGADAARQARRWIPWEPALAGFESGERLMLYRSTGAVDERDRALALARRAVELDPQSFIVRARAAATDYEIGPGTEAQRRTRATRDLEVALRLNPWSAQVLGMLHDLAVQGHDDAAAARWAHKLCEMNLCPEPVPEDPAGN